MKITVNHLTPEQCVLCGACRAACSRGAISYENEHCGFYYPVIDPDLCVSCGRCAAVCPVVYPPVSEPVEPDCCAAMSPDDNIRMASTSGGVFYEAARYILSIGGYVCGAVFTDDFSVRHIISRDPRDVDAMRGSKYVQSDVGDCYERIRALLMDGQTVLFCGCPCQSAALRTRLAGVDTSGLYVMDFVCRGIPSGETWHTYLSMQEKKYGAPVSAVSFRSKRMGWHRSSMLLTFANGKEYNEPITADAYFKGFIYSDTLKESCYACPFREYRSGSDMTVGDFWGAETVLPDADDNKGISLVLTHTDKGRSLLSQLSLKRFDVPLSDAVQHNENLLRSPRVNVHRALYYNVRAEKGEEAAMKTYLVETRRERIRRRTLHRVRTMRNKLSGKKNLY